MPLPWKISSCTNDNAIFLNSSSPPVFSRFLVLFSGATTTSPPPTFYSALSRRVPQRRIAFQRRGTEDPPRLPSLILSPLISSHRPSRPTGSTDPHYFIQDVEEEGGCLRRRLRCRRLLSQHRRTTRRILTPAPPGFSPPSFFGRASNVIFVSPPRPHPPGEF